MIDNNNMSNENLNCFTIGHSNHSNESFLFLLKKYNVEYIIDVRSNPYSKYAVNFNRELLKKTLAENHILYSYMGDDLGARYSNPSLIDQDGKVSFNKVRSTKKFQHALEKLKNEIVKGYTIAILCSEKDPLDCHRFVLISRCLVDKNININHILTDGTKISNQELEKVLLKKYKVQPSFFDLTKSKIVMLDEAYNERSKDIAYTVK